jgi:gliding motility-associated-like protein
MIVEFNFNFAFCNNLILSRYIRYKILLFLFILSFAGLSQPVSAPQFRSVSVALNGDVTLCWVQPVDPGNNFVSYEIYSSPNIGGPYTLLNSIPTIVTTNYIHVGANANVTQRFYYITTRYNSGMTVMESSPSDTLASIKLNVANPGNGTALLTWNHMHTPPLPTQILKYRIWREFPATVWTLIDSTSNTNYKDTIYECNATINWRVETFELSACNPIFSSWAGGPFTDVLGPNTPIIDSVSINPITGNLEIGWQPNASPDAQHYLVYVYDASQSPPWVKIDSLYGRNNTYTSLAGSCGGNPKTYAIAAFDNCNLSSLISQGHTIMKLDYTLDACKREVALTWNAYSGWVEGVQQYDIWASKDGLPYTLLGTVSRTTTNFIHQNAEDFAQYCYFVRARAKNSTKSSSSCVLCVNIDVPAKPTFCYVKYATVLSKTQVEVSVHVDTLAGVGKYIIQRLENFAGLFQKILEFKPADVVGSTLTFIDSLVNTDENSYAYRVIIEDECEDKVFTSNIGRTILLQALNIPTKAANILKWNDYEQWLEGPVLYEIHKSINSVFDSLPIKTIFTPAELTYEDFLIENYESNGQFCYYVEALEMPEPKFTFVSKSRSNILCLSQEPFVFIPNSFTPDGNGLNDVFIPKWSFVSKEGYTMRIFSRRGVMLFETNDPFEAWDGTYRGDMMQNDTYIYDIYWQSAKGDKYTRRGTVTLIR